MHQEFQVVAQSLAVGVIRHEIPDESPDHAAFLRSVQAFQRRVGEGDAAFLVVFLDAIGQQIHQGAEALLAFAQPFLDLLALGDVHIHPDHAPGPVGGIAQHSTVRQRPPERAVRPRETHFQAIVGAALDRVFDRLFQAVAICGMHEVAKPVQSHWPTLALQAEHRPQVVRPENFARLDVPFPGAHERGAHGQAHVLLAFAQPLLDLLALGDVGDSSDSAARPAGLVPVEALAPVQNPDPVPRAVANAVLRLELHRLSLHPLFEDLNNPGAVVRMDGIQPALDRDSDLVGRKSEHPQIMLVHFDSAGLQVRVVKSQIGAIDRERQAFLGELQRLLCPFEVGDVASVDHDARDDARFVPIRRISHVEQSAALIENIEPVPILDQLAGQTAIQFVFQSSSKDLFTHDIADGTPHDHAVRPPSPAQVFVVDRQINVVQVEQRYRVGGGRHDTPVMAQRLLDPLALHQIHRHGGQFLHRRHVVVGVVLRLVAHADDREDRVAVQEGHDEFPNHRDVASRQAVATGQAGAVVADDRRAAVEAFHPDAGSADRIVQTLAVGLAKAPQGTSRPSLKGEVFLVGIDEMKKTDLAAGEILHRVQRGLQQVVESALSGDVRQAQAGF